MNWGVRGGEEPPIHCRDFATGSLRAVVSPPLQSPRQSPENFFFLDPILGWADLPMVLCVIFTHGFGCDGFWSMVLDVMVFGPWFLDAMVFGPWYWMLRHV